MSETRDNLKAGVFVLGGIALTIVVVFSLAEYKTFFEKKQTVVVRFALGDGLRGLKEGASVTLGDVPIGSVNEIRDLIENDRVVAQDVVLSIPARYRLHRDAIVELKAPFIGSGAALNVRSVGGAAPLYQSGDVIAGDMAPSELAAQFVKELGVREQERMHIRRAIANFSALSETLKNEAPLITESVKQILEDAKPLTHNVRLASEDARQLMADLKERSGPWMQRADNISQRVDQLIQDKDPTVRNTLDNLEAVTERAREETMQQVHDALEKTDKAMANLRDATAELKTWVHANGPVLERAMANFQLTAAQLKLAAIEVRRSPWRLLYQPKDQEIAHDNLYDAARSFALAAGAVDAALASLDHLVQIEPDNKDAIQQRIDYLDDLFQRFEEAEKRFWGELDESR